MQNEELQQYNAKYKERLVAADKQLIAYKERSAELSEQVGAKDCSITELQEANTQLGVQLVQEQTKCLKHQSTNRALQEKNDLQSAELEKQKSHLQRLLTADKVNHNKQEQVSRHILLARDQAR